MPRIFKGRRKLAAIGIIPALLAGGAFAYFLAGGTGSGNGHYSTGAPASVALTITIGAPVGAGLVPGGPSQTIPVSVTNPSAGAVTFTLAPTINSGAGNVLRSDGAFAQIPGCLASWFTDTMQTGGTYTVAAGATTVVDSIVVTMPADAADNQSACENQTPYISVTAG